MIMFLFILVAVGLLAYLIVFLVDRRRSVALSWASVAVALTVAGYLLVLAL